MYTPEQLRIAFEDIAKGYGWPLDMGEVAYLSSETEKLWQGFRWGVNCDATLKPAQGGVTEAMYRGALQAWIDRAELDFPARLLAALEAALSAEPAAQGEVLIEAVGRVERDMTGELDINWLVEDGIHAIGEGSILLCADRDNVTDDYGRATLYTAPPAQPAERVPEGMVLVPREPTEAMVDSALALHGDDAFIAKAPALASALVKIYRAMLAASTAPSEGGKGVDRD